MTNISDPKPDKSNYNILIASYLEPNHVDRTRQADDRLNVIYEPELLRAPRYAADHTGQPFECTPAQETRWRQLLSKADILFDFDQTHREDLPALAPKVRWIQATSTGFTAQRSYLHQHWPGSAGG